MISKKPVLLVIINVFVFLATVAVNALAGSIKLLNCVRSVEVSETYPTLITPAGFTFSIWGVIYTLLLVFAVYQAMPKSRDKQFLKQINILFALNGVWNLLLFLWHYQLVTYILILIIALLATIIDIYLRLDIGRASVSLK